MIPNGCYFDEEGLGGLDLLNFFDQFSFILPAPIGRAEALFQLLHTLLELGLLVVDRMHVLSHFLEVAVQRRDLPIDFLHSRETLFFLLIVLVQLVEELAELALDGVSALLAFAHRSSGLVLLGHLVLEVFLQLFDLLVDVGHLEVVLSVVRLSQGLLRHGGHNRVNCHKEVISTLAPFCKLILSEPRIERLLRLEGRVLVRHFLPLFVEGDAGLLLPRQLLLLLLCLVVFGIAVVAICVLGVGTSCGGWGLGVVITIGFIVISDGGMRLITTSAIASSASACASFVLLCTGGILCVILVGCGASS